MRSRVTKLESSAHPDMPEAMLTLVPFPDDSSLTSEGQGFNVEVEVMESGPFEKGEGP